MSAAPTLPVFGDDLEVWTESLALTTKAAADQVLRRLAAEEHRTLRAEFPVPSSPPPQS